MSLTCTTTSNGLVKGPVVGPAVDTSGIDFGTATVRPAVSSQADIGSIAVLGRERFNQTFGAVVPAAIMQEHLDSAYSHEGVLAELVNPARRCLVAEAGDRDGRRHVLGFAIFATDATEDCLKPYPNPVKLLRIYTYRIAHGKGIAAALMQACYKLAKDEGYGHIWLGVHSSNIRARRFYEKENFVAVGVHSFVMLNQSYEDDVLLHSLAQ